MNKLFSYTILAVLLLLSTHAEAQSKVKAQYLEETELVSIVAHLAEVSGYDWDVEDVGVDDYLAEVDSYFATYRSHPIVPFIRKELYGEGFNWHFPMHIALRLHIVDGKITYDEVLVKDFDGYYERISREDEEQFITLLQDFYKVSNFHEFFVRHKALYAECETAMQRVINQVDFSWYDSFFGPRENSTFHIYTNILIGPANYAVHQKRKDGLEIINAVMGCCNRSKQGDIQYDTYSTLPIIVHECNHSYCNPLNEEFWPQLREKMEAFFAPNAKHYADEAYGNPQYVLNETFVEASVMHYLMTHPFDFSENTQRWKKVLKVSEEQYEAAPDKAALLNEAYIKLLTKIDYEDKRFYMIHDIIDALKEREQKRDLYPTMHDFMPRYIKVVNAFGNKDSVLQRVEELKALVDKKYWPTFNAPQYSLEMNYYEDGPFRMHLVANDNESKPRMECSAPEVTFKAIPDVTTYEEWYAMLIHECFHGFVYKKYPQFWNKMIEVYPHDFYTSDSLKALKENYGWYADMLAKENSLLSQMLAAKEITEVKQLWAEFLPIRNERLRLVREQLGLDIELFYPMTETNEGTARYIEYCLYQEQGIESKVNWMMQLDSSSYYYASGLYMILIMEKFGIEFRDDLFERNFTLTELMDDKL